jgi:RNA polymerase sigma-70 factor (sigma-E family)
MADGGEDPPGDELGRTGNSRQGRGWGRDRRGDDFTGFVAANAGRLLRTAYLLTGDRGAAEDLLQDVLEKTYVAWPRVKDPHAYVRTAMGRQAINRWRRRRPERETRLTDDHDVAVGDAVAELAEQAAVAQALRALPARQRATLVLRYFDDLSEAQTAAALGCSIGTVKSQSSRALATLRRVMSSDGAGAGPELGLGLGNGPVAPTPPSTLHVVERSLS